MQLINFNEFFMRESHIFPKTRSTKNIKRQAETKHFYSGKCFHVSKFLQFYFGLDKTRLMMIPDVYDSLGVRSTHWFIKLNGEILDLTKDQFDSEPDYDRAICKEFAKPYFVGKSKTKSKQYPTIVPSLTTIQFFNIALLKDEVDLYGNMQYWVNEYNKFISQSIL